MNSIYGEHYNPTIKPAINLDDVRVLAENWANFGAWATDINYLRCTAKRLLEQIGEKE